MHSWIESGEPGDWREQPYPERHPRLQRGRLPVHRPIVHLAQAGRARTQHPVAITGIPSEPPPPRELSPEVVARLDTAAKLRRQRDAVSAVLADVIDFHRREEKPMWWRMFDRAEATSDALRDDPACIEGLEAVGSPAPEKQSLVQTYRFDPSQECKLAAGDSSKVMFTHNLEAKLTLSSLDASAGRLELKLGKKSVGEKFGGAFPQAGFTAAARACLGDSHSGGAGRGRHAAPGQPSA